MSDFENNLLKMVVDHYGLQKLKVFIEDMEKNAEPVKHVLAPKKRISKITAKNLEILENAFAYSNTLLVDKLLKTKFMDYINSLDDETFASNDLVHHANTFAQEQGVGIVNTTTTTNTKPKRKVTPEYKEDVQLETVDYNALKEMEKHLTKLKSYPHGIFWNKELNTFVTGPAEADDEEVSIVTFNEKVYHVGDNTNRVYQVIEGDNVDGEFCGYYGIDEFKKMNKV